MPIEVDSRTEYSETQQGRLLNGTDETLVGGTMDEEDLMSQFTSVLGLAAGGVGGGHGRSKGLPAAAGHSKRSEESSRSGIASPRRSASFRASKSAHSDVYSAGDEHSLFDETPRRPETLRMRRMSKRKRRDEEEEEDDRVLLGTKVGPGHTNYTIMYNMLTGIRVGVSRCTAKLDRELTDTDFTAAHKFTFDIIGTELTPSAKYDFKFKDYAPWVFRHLRQMFHLDPADYLISLTSKYILSELNSPGKSGSFFYFSRDYRFIIKTISQREHKFLRKILKDYYRHIQNNPHTLISQFYGLHRVKEPYGRKIHFLVMKNLFPPHRDIHQTFDLKGSICGRELQEQALKSNPRATLKDLNWIRRNMLLHLGPQKRGIFLEQLDKDVNMLQQLHIMDYSLLIGIHDLARGNKENIRDATLSMFQPEPEVFPISRTPSKYEQVRKARELRKKVTAAGPIAIDVSTLPHDLHQGHEPNYNKFYSDNGGIRATNELNEPDNVIYYFGLIDCLTRYNTRKHVETFLKGLRHAHSQISAIAPNEYRERFMNFIAKQITNKQDHENTQEQPKSNEPEQVFSSMEGNNNAILPVVKEDDTPNVITEKKDLCDGLEYPSLPNLETYIA